ncbi:hypothetical protein DIS16_10105 [Levilactobacillus brevis]|uniref:hypothetical protein n=1 Tax=Levilactobacillus brevis TaxID=1580 RepID=UPI00111EF763|nr:hypothetical protein [Levilactobacillus brevis]TOY75130.1 hypothetical protein DIS16_10105 [Levilactobacillus brevis]
MPIYYVKPDSDNKFPDGITAEDYKAITGEAYVASTTQAPTTQAPTTQAPTAQATTTSTTN